MSWGIVAGLGVAAWAFAMALRQLPGTGPHPAAEAPADPVAAPAFVRHCGACHQASDLAQGLSGPDAAAAMIKLLGRHGTAPLADDLRIVAELAAMNEAAAP